MEKESTVVKRIDALETAFGESPDPILNKAGEGVLGALAKLATKLDELGTRVTEIVNELATEREARLTAAKERRELRLLVAKLLAVPAAGVGVTALLHFLGRLHP